MSHLMMSGLNITNGACEKGKSSGITQEQNKWFDGIIPHAIVGPRTVVIHFIATSIANTAVMHIVDFLSSAT